MCHRYVGCDKMEGTRKECGGFEDFIIICYIKSKRTICHMTFPRMYWYMIHSICCRTGPESTILEVLIQPRF
jgi:hypothetical protein